MRAGSVLPRLLGAALGALALATAGCDQHDMVVQPKYETFQPSDFFADGQSSRPIEPGTVARGQYLGRPAFETGDVDGKVVSYIPLKGFDPNEKLGEAEAKAARKATLERGRERYNIYCTPCHAKTGDGNGMVVQRGFSPPPSFHEKRLKEVPPGHFFHVITNGYGAMYSYAARVAPADRWAIAAYIRALQLSRDDRQVAAALPAVGNADAAGEGPVR